jgi:4-amino-4-deoxy-L-arabinose transferase-like glycosyltransferase
VAALAYALWPAGIAVSSVTGTDLPAAVLILAAVWVLVRFGRLRSGWGAAVGFGALMGLGAWVRAVNVPLAAFAGFYFLSIGLPWRQAAARAGAALGIAFVLLAPWVLRNHARYGEWFLTDSHGGLTALVGANPNSDGRYSRSLNRVFKEVTGYTLLAEPHRQSDRAAYQLAREWTAFSPAYAAGLVVTKAERLLAHERSLLYWPLYRQGVLPAGPTRDFFDRHRPGLERLADWFWWGLAGAYFAGVGVALLRRRWPALAFVPIQAALAGVYALYFAEVRYHLPIAALMFPLAAVGVVEVGRGAAAAGRARRLPAGWPAPVAWTAGALALLLVGWPALRWAGGRLRERHRFAAHVCQVDGRASVCLWRPTGSGDSPVRGVWDGFGLQLDRRDGRGQLAATTVLSLPAGRWRVRILVDLVPAPRGAGSAFAGTVGLRAQGSPGANATLAEVAAASAAGVTTPLETTVATAGQPLALELTVAALAPTGPGVALWASAVSVARAD